MYERKADDGMETVPWEKPDPNCKRCLGRGKLNFVVVGKDKRDEERCICVVRRTRKKAEREMAERERVKKEGAGEMKVKEIEGGAK